MAAAAGHRSLDVQVHLTVVGAETWAPMVYGVPTMDGYCESCRLVGKQTHDAAYSLRAISSSTEFSPR